MNWRRIVVDGCTWRYHVGSSYFAFRGPRSFVATVGEVKGLHDSELVERGRWKVSSDGMITPRDVASFLSKNGVLTNSVGGT